MVSEQPFSIRWNATMKRLIIICLVVATGMALAETPPSMQGRSSKRGVCVNQFSEADARALSPGVSWFYSWYFECTNVSPSVGLEFYPMVWGDAPEYLAGFESSLKAGATPSHVLVLNEPNLKGQAFITPQRSAELYARVEALAKPRGIKMIGPHMALGSSTESSITAFDPIEQKDITYTYMIPYLNAFIHHLGGADRLDAVAVHSYGNMSELTWLVDLLQKTYPGKDIWITEFAWWDAKDEADEIAFMKEAVSLFERTPAVKKYAWFMARMKDNQRMSLLTDQPGELTELGRTYISLPAQ